MGVSLRYGGGRAFYSPQQDAITLPPKASFVCLNVCLSPARRSCLPPQSHRLIVESARLVWRRVPPAPSCQAEIDFLDAEGYAGGVRNH
jgi:hypothetical protein